MRVDSNKLCFISCVNDDYMYREALCYIQALKVPAGMNIDLVDIRNAESMTAGYQAGMEASDAKYKIYMHQDVFLINRNIIECILEIFNRDKSIGMLGVAGSRVLSWEKPIWFMDDTKCGKVYSKKAAEYIDVDIFGEIDKPWENVMALDGMFLVTQYDLPWRTDLFKDWHFYDISQCFEFINAGYQVVLPQQDRPWIIHACGMRGTNKSYVENMNIFKANYQW